MLHPLFSQDRSHCRSNHFHVEANSPQSFDGSSRCKDPQADSTISVSLHVARFSEVISPHLSPISCIYHGAPGVHVVLKSKKKKFFYLKIKILGLK